jgi:hypothetical protein
MKNETKEINLSVAVIEPVKDQYGKLDVSDERVVAVAKEQPNLIVIPRFTDSLARLTRAYMIAKTIKNDVAMFSQTNGHAQRIDSYTPFNNNPLLNLKYEVKDVPFRGREDLDLDLLVLFGGEKIDREAPALRSLGQGGCGIWVDNHRNYEVFHKQLGETGTVNNTVFGNEKKIKNCSWYDLKF